MVNHGDLWNYWNFLWIFRGLVLWKLGLNHSMEPGNNTGSPPLNSWRFDLHQVAEGCNIQDPIPAQEMEKRFFIGGNHNFLPQLWVAPASPESDAGSDTSGPHLRNWNQPVGRPSRFPQLQLALTNPGPTDPTPLFSLGQDASSWISGHSRAWSHPQSPTQPCMACPWTPWSPSLASCVCPRSSPPYPWKDWRCREVNAWVMQPDHGKSGNYLFLYVPIGHGMSYSKFGFPEGTVAWFSWMKSDSGTAQTNSDLLLIIWYPACFWCSYRIWLINQP